MNPYTPEERFICQSLADNQADYQASIEGLAPTWDWAVLTASNDRQAEAYRLQLDRRLQNGSLPRRCRYAVVADPMGRRCGSGGATFNAYALIAKEVGIDAVPHQKVLMIHSGGDSKRLPQYSAIGKLFSPAPHDLPDGRRATLFDDLMVAVAGIPARIHGGTLVMPSDTEVAFNPLQLDLESADAAGLSMKAPVAEGAEHGVFLGDGGGVARFLHKLPERELEAAGAVDARGRVDIDTGCIWLGASAVDALLGMVSRGGEIDPGAMALFGGSEACLSLYSDFLYPMGAQADFDEYMAQKPEGALSDELLECRRALWPALFPLRMRLVRLAPARYIHFGTTWELRELMTKRTGEFGYLGWKRQVLASCASEGPVLSNALVERGASVDPSAYVEDSVVDASASVGEGSIVSGIDVRGRAVPAGCAVSGIPLEGGGWVCRIYGCGDNPKESSGAPFLGTTLDTIIAAAGIPREEVWDSVPASIWNARIYPVCGDQGAALDAALLLHRIAFGEASPDEISEWASSERESLASSFARANVATILGRADEVGDAVCVARFVGALREGREASAAEAELGRGERLPLRMRAALAEAGPAGFPLNMRILLALSELASTEGVDDVLGAATADLEDRAYAIVREGVLSAVRVANPQLDAPASFTKGFAECDLPVRVNFCGSPSDAAPYCIEHGGTMLDAALLLKGELPVHAEAERIDAPVFIFESVDQGIRAAFDDIAEIRCCGNPADPFALHKACVAATGVLEGFGSLEEFRMMMGGGLRLSTSVDVPKGSGLGTSSILAAGCCRALNELFGIEGGDDLVFDQVFVAEQLMGTCGGWQDQVGGLAPGIKFFTSAPGMHQVIRVELLKLEVPVLKELEDRFALVFSGQRRLARSVLRAETNALARNEVTALAAIERIQELCALMRHHLLKGNVTAFARCMDEQLEQVKLLDRGATNTCVDYIFDACGDLVDGRSVCGAGGGGFLQMVLKKGVSKRQLAQRLENVFGGCGVELWETSFYFGTEGSR